MDVNTGFTLGLTTMVTTVVAEHRRTSGTKVYVAVARLLTVAGVQLPGMPLSDMMGNNGAVEPEQITVSKLKTGTICGSTVMDMAAVEAHCPFSGVKW